MSNQSHLNRAIRFATALALLAAVMTSPIRPANAALASGTSQVDGLPHNFAIPGKATTSHHRSHAPVTSRVVQVKALSSRRDLDWTSDPARHRVGPLQAPCLAAGPPSTALGFDQKAHPLRC